MVADLRPGQARLRSRGTTLVPLAPEHLAGLRNLELAQGTAFRWRHGGAHPSPDEFAVGAWTDVLCTFLVFGDRAGEPRGIVSAYAPDHVNGHCRVGSARFGDSAGPSPTFARGVFLLFDYLFCGWPFRKLYLEVPQFNLDQFGSLTDTIAVDEATLRE